MATDCADGLYCFGVTLTMAGTCTANPDKAQPAGEGGIPDGGVAPMPDQFASDAPVTPMDTSTPTDTSTPKKDTAPPEETGPTDTGAKDTATGG